MQFGWKKSGRLLMMKLTFDNEIKNYHKFSVPSLTLRNLQRSQHPIPGEMYIDCIFYCLSQDEKTLYRC